MARKINVSIVQMETEQMAIERNLERGLQFISEAARRGSKLVMLPELWTTGFDWKKCAEIVADHEWVHAEVARRAKQESVWVTGTLLAADNEGKASNVAFLFSPEGEIVCRYAKTHLFPLTGEDQHFSAGDELVQYDAPFGKIGFTICYELRFPELFRSNALSGAELIICPAGFPDYRRDHWRTLLRARAIENQCFILAANRVGSEPINEKLSANYFGASCMIDPWGELVVEAGRSESIITAQIDLDEVVKIRKKIPVFRGRRPELY